MTQAAQPRGMFQYFGSHADHLFHATSSGLQNVFDRVRNAVNSLSNAYQSVSYGLRQEVPFERWFYDFGFQTPIQQTPDLIKAHVWAVIATLEGLVRTAAEAVCYVYSRFMAPDESHRHLDVLKAQAQGLTLSMLAIISPNAAKEKAHNPNGTPNIGDSLRNWKWGTLYLGTLDAPLWKIECSYYPWPNRV